MPNGDVHAKVAESVSVGLGLIGVGIAIIHPPAVGVAAGGWLGRIVDPDLDLHQHITQSERKIIKFNRWLGAAWVLYWKFTYALNRPHRGVSHTWPIGTLERYFLALWPLLAVSVGLVVLSEGDWLWPILLWWLWVFVGLSVQDVIHIMMDTISTRLRRRLRAK